MDGALGGGRVGRAGGSEISGTAARMMLDFARGAGLALDPLVAGLRFDARTVKRLRRVPWDDYCTLVERLEVAAGGPLRLDALIVASFHQAAAPAVQTVIRSLVSPRNLYRFVFKILNPANFPNTDFEYKEQADGWIWLSCQLHDDARPCAAFMRGSLAALRGFRGHLGLPPAEVKVEELTDRSLVALSRLPESRTLMARASVPSLAALRNAAVTLVELFAGDARESPKRAPARTSTWAAAARSTTVADGTLTGLGGAFGLSVY
jgi:hypothetical protein